MSKLIFLIMQQKNATGFDTSERAAKSDLASLKDEIDKLDIDKLILVPVDSSKLSDIVKNGAVKKIVYDKLVAKVNNVDISGFVLKSKYDTDKSDLEKKVTDTSGIVKKLNYNAKTSKTEGNIPSISGLATTTALTAVENKIPGSLVQKTDYDAKISEIEKKLTNHDIYCYFRIQQVYSRNSCCKISASKCNSRF